MCRECCRALRLTPLEGWKAALGVTWVQISFYLRRSHAVHWLMVAICKGICSCPEMLLISAYWLIEAHYQEKLKRTFGIKADSLMSSLPLVCRAIALMFSIKEMNSGICFLFSFSLFRFIARAAALHFLFSSISPGTSFVFWPPTATYLPYPEEEYRVVYQVVHYLLLTS